MSDINKAALQEKLETMARERTVTQPPLLRRALREYGNHTPACGIAHGEYPCGCGWAELLEALKAVPTK